MAKVLIHSFSDAIAIPEDVIEAVRNAGHEVVALNDFDGGAEIDIAVLAGINTPVAWLIGRKPAIGIYVTEAENAEALRLGTIWNVPLEPYLSVSLLEGSCRIEHAIAVASLTDVPDTIPAEHRAELLRRAHGFQSFLCGFKTPAGVHKALLELLED